MTLLELTETKDGEVVDTAKGPPEDWIVAIFWTLDSDQRRSAMAGVRQRVAKRTL